MIGPGPIGKGLARRGVFLLQFVNVTCFTGAGRAGRLLKIAGRNGRQGAGTEKIQCF